VAQRCWCSHWPAKPLLSERNRAGAVEAEDPVDQPAGDLAERNLTPVRGEFNHRASAPPVPVPGREERVSLPDREPLPGAGQARRGREPVPMARASHRRRARVWELGHLVQGSLRAQVWVWELGHAVRGLLPVREWAPLVPGHCHMVITQPFPRGGLRLIMAAIGVPA
jgi:hypothetical protein